MIRAFVVGAVLGLGVWAVLRGLFPDPVPLRNRIQTRLDSGLDGDRRPTVEATTATGRIAMWLLRHTRGEMLPETEADVAITGGTLEAYALDKLKAGAAGVVIVPVCVLLMGIAESVPVLILLSVLGAVVFYFVPDLELKKKAAQRRDEFDRTLNDFVSLVAVSITGGGGVNSAMLETTRIGDGWVFEALGRSLQDSLLVGEPPWNGFEQLGRRLNVPGLTELASALSLAGNSGARVTDTLRARAQSGRDRDLSEARAEAEKRSESMGLPLAALLVGWIGFLGYPAVVNLIGS